MVIETVLGIATGLIGNIITAFTNYKTQKMKNEHDVQMADLNIKKLIAQTNASIKIAQAKITGEVELADSKAYDTSQQVGNKSLLGDGWIEKLLAYDNKYLSWLTTICAVLLATGLGFVDFLKGLIRPGLTLYLTGITTWITWKAYEILQATGNMLTSSQAFALYSDVTNIVVYLTVSCITWWFGDRRIAKGLMRQRDRDTTTTSLITAPNSGK